jgi:hypothetical protein
MRDLEERADRALAVFSEAIPVWQMIAGSLTCFAGLDLGTVSQDERRKIEGSLSQVNGVFSQYSLQSSENYKTMAHSHQFEVLAIVASFCESILEKPR